MISSDWDDARFDLAAVAAGTGPFPRRPFLETWWRHRAGDGDQLLISAHDRGVVQAMTGADGTVRFLGEADLTDYHSPLGGDLGPLFAELAETAPGAPFRFDSLPEEAAQVVVAALDGIADEVTQTQHEIAAVLPLPTSYETYLERIGKKERHETRRKRRRFEAALGQPRLVRVEGGQAVADFAVMHTKAVGDKGTFFTAPMVEFFTALHHDAEALIHVLVGDDDTPVAAAFGFDEGGAYYLYNSAYDPTMRDASPGVVLVSMLIERAIAQGRGTFDFLKGNETYKFRLGATERPLFAVTGRFRTT